MMSSASRIESRIRTCSTARRCMLAWGVVSLLAGGESFGQSAKEVELENRIAQLEKKLNERTPTGPVKNEAPTVMPHALPGTRVVFYGFLKLDAMWSKYADGEILDGSIGRDFYLPSTIPVGGAGESVDLDAHIKQSRFVIGTDTDLADGKLLQSRLEFDLYGSALGDERATNTYGLQVRHAYIQYGRWLFGQTWTNFQDALTLPETTDFIGPTDGTVFTRQPMVKYSVGNFSISVENPETTITPFGGGARIASDDNNVPDVVGTYTFKFGSHYIRAAAIARQLRYETTGANAISDTTYTGALSVAGKFVFGKDDLRFMVTGGDSLGRYIGVNFNNDAVLDAGGKLQTISGWAGFAAYRHYWTTDWRSTLMVSASSYDNDVALTGAAANKSTWSVAANAFYSPTPKLDLGLELRRATRKLESGADGSMDRLQLTAKYSF